MERLRQWLNRNNQALTTVATSFVATVIVILFFNQQANNARQIKDMARLLDTQKLILEQTKALAEQSNSIAKESQGHIDCIADLFARYTRERKGITIEDLDTCQTKANEVASILPPGASPAPPLEEAQPDAPSSTATPTPPPDNRNTVQRILDSVTNWIDELP